MYQGVSAIICKAFDRKHSNIPKLELEAAPPPPPQLYYISPDWFEYCFVYMRSLLPVESSVLCLSNQYILRNMSVELFWPSAIR
jgi:hypothetical protein